MPLRIEISHIRYFRWLRLLIIVLRSTLPFFQTVQKLLRLLHALKIIVLNYDQISFTWILVLLSIFKISRLFQRVSNLITLETSGSSVPSVWALLLQLGPPRVLIRPFILHTFGLSAVLFRAIAIRLLKWRLIQSPYSLLIHCIFLRIIALIIYTKIIFLQVKLNSIWIIYNSGISMS